MHLRSTRRTRQGDTRIGRRAAPRLGEGRRESQLWEGFRLRRGRRTAPRPPLRGPRSTRPKRPRIFGRAARPSLADRRPPPPIQRRVTTRGWASISYPPIPSHQPPGGPTAARGLSLRPATDPDSNPDRARPILSPQVPRSIARTRVRRIIAASAVAAIAAARAGFLSPTPNPDIATTKSASSGDASAPSPAPAARRRPQRVPRPAITA